MLLACFLGVSVEGISGGRENLSPLSGANIIDAVEESRLRDTISHLQSLGNRMSWEKQWEAANCA